MRLFFDICTAVFAIGFTLDFLMWLRKKIDGRKRCPHGVWPADECYQCEEAKEGQ